MRAFDFHQLSHEAQVLVRQTVDHLSPCYDAERHLVYRLRNGERVHENRASLYYALGILMTGQKDCIATAEALCHAVDR